MTETVLVKTVFRDGDHRLFVEETEAGNLAVSNDIDFHDCVFLTPAMAAEVARVAAGVAAKREAAK